ncbi:hypothetical protein ACOI99_06830 [Corynebacterium striatum]|uniref:hypothetical protein n=1 Tax=Corynebacterium striatum TaxID=43770 RepID=UPI003B5A2D75
MHLNLNHNAERSNADHDEPELLRVLVEGEAAQLTVGVDKPKPVMSSDFLDSESIDFLDLESS